jgi:hypothetical protein
MMEDGKRKRGTVASLGNRSHIVRVEGKNKFDRFDSDLKDCLVTTC